MGIQKVILSFRTSMREPSADIAGGTGQQNFSRLVYFMAASFWPDDPREPQPRKFALACGAFMKSYFALQVAL